MQQVMCEEFIHMNFNKFMWQEFIPEIARCRFVGYVKLYLRSKRNLIAIFVRKRDLYVVAISDGDKLYEVGYEGDGARYFGEAHFTNFGEKYRHLFPGSSGERTGQRLRGIELGFGVLQYHIGAWLSGGVPRGGNNRSWKGCGIGGHDRCATLCFERSDAREYGWQVSENVGFD